MRYFLSGLTAVLCSHVACERAPAQEDTAYFEMAYRTEAPELLMRIYRPPGWTDEDNRPAIVFFFGGGWTSGSPDQFDPHCKRLSELGFVAMAAEYRIKSKHQSTPFDSFEDAKAAIRWVRENASTFGVNPERIAAGGGSAGGHLATATAVCLSQELSDIRDTPDAIVAFNPALDLRMPAVKGKWGEEIYAKIEEISPLQNITAEHPPMIIFHGEADSTVPFDSAQTYVEAAKAAGVDPIPVLVGYPGKEHGFFNFQRNGGLDYEDTVTRMIAFFRSLGWIEAEPGQ
jgi:acetyl esterase